MEQKLTIRVKKSVAKSSIPAAISRFDHWVAHTPCLDAKPHQRDGVKWCLINELKSKPLQGVRGGLVADEMGLGKTYTMIGTIVANRLQRTLIVLPLALLGQWNRHILKTTDMTPVIFHGTERRQISFSELTSAPVVLTTYDVISGGGTTLHRIHWSRVMFDEAHHLRNSETSRFYGAHTIKANIRWLITGTPIQNRLDDFYALCNMMGLKSKFYTQKCNLKPIARNFLMKRTKEQVGLKLPEKRQHKIVVPWKSAQERQIAEDLHASLAFTGADSKGRKPNNAVARLSQFPLPLMLRARQTCVMPGLIQSGVGVIDGDFFDSTDEKEVFSAAMGSSSKIDAVIDVLKKRQNNKRCKLVFCHFRGEIDALCERAAREGMSVARFDGRTPKDERERLLQSKCDVLVLQIQTGCEGLNLQQFKEVYFVSPTWNPAIEDQAVARSHRIGQTEPVDVFRFVMEGFDQMAMTLDSHVERVQTFKRKEADMLDTVKSDEKETKAATAAANPVESQKKIVVKKKKTAAAKKKLTKKSTKKIRFIFPKENTRSASIEP